tara:strand:+ start:106 stop:603 length:498 start_codon:yes stop_codon:yes gene_type:complete
MKIRLLAIGLCALFISSCASIFTGTTQEVNFNSQPTGAKIYIDGEDYGNTPRTIELRRKGHKKGDESKKKEYDVKIELNGYHPYELKIKRSTQGWFWGNILLGGVIGMIIDASNGAMYKLTPEQIVAQMSNSSAMVDSDDDQLKIMVTLNADPRWEKVGQLERID